MSGPVGLDPVLPQSHGTGSAEEGSGALGRDLDRYGALSRARSYRLCATHAAAGSEPGPQGLFI